MIRRLAAFALAAWAAEARASDVLLHAARAEPTRGVDVYQPAELNALHVTIDLAERPRLRWQAEVRDDGEYRIRLLARSRAPGVVPAVRIGSSPLIRAGKALPGEWDRVEVGGLRLAKGRHEVELGLEPTGAATGVVELQAIELAEADRAADDSARAAAARADTSWLRKAGFGVMLHWTRESAPAQGPRRPYAEAVRSLDAQALAERLAATGAGFVVFTTSHAHQDFPAPLAALDKALPGRTTPRDLVADLAGALGKRGIRLMLYHHPGSPADHEWVESCGLRRGDTERHFALWQAVISEAGERYGDRLAGWWFDDGATGFYPRRAPWEALHRAARAGHPGRLVAFNSWELPSVTDWQDFDCGEGLREPRGREGRLGEFDTGIYPSSSRRGQQATACVMLEDDWLHRAAGRMPSPPAWTLAELRSFLSRSRRTGLVPILNLKVTQEGLLGPESVELVRRASDATR